MGPAGLKRKSKRKPDRGPYHGLPLHEDSLVGGPPRFSNHEQISPVRASLPIRAKLALEVNFVLAEEFALVGKFALMGRSALMEYPALMSK